MLTLSDRYFQQAIDTLSQLETVTKPILILLISVVVGAVILVMFSALFQMPGLIPLRGV
jgi:type II secretory pathway component PulF